MEIKHGSTRIVFIFKQFVIKTPNVKEYRLFLNGILSNLQEKEWSKIGRKDLCKVHFCDVFGLVLIMRKAKPLQRNIKFKRFKEILNQKYKDDNLKEFMLSDLKLSNWGWVDGKLVKVDYGS